MYITHPEYGEKGSSLILRPKLTFPDPPKTITEGVSNSEIRSQGAPVNSWWDGLWFGERKGPDGEKAIVAGDLRFDPLRLMPTDPKAADLMRLKELKNGRLAMLAIIGIFQGYLNTGDMKIF